MPIQINVHERRDGGNREIMANTALEQNPEVQEAEIKEEEKGEEETPK